MPIEKRVFATVAQSMSIQFGNIMEQIIHELMAQTDRIELVSKCGQTSGSREVTVDSLALIDDYIFRKKSGETSLTFSQLLNEIAQNEFNSSLAVSSVVYDTDLVFKDSNSSTIFYAELKLSDNHDSGKTVDIYRKWLKTYACLVRQFGPEVKVVPLMVYINDSQIKSSPYCDSSSIYTGKRLLDEFTPFNFDDISKEMELVANSEATRTYFDLLETKIKEKSI